MEVNIPRSVTDIYYRYKMPVIQTKIEGKGNGIRTIITNMEKIMKSLDRSLDYGTKFIGFELGTKTKADLANHNCVIAGKHDEKQLSLCLDKFIDMYVLCTKCRNPETVFTIKKNLIMSNCKACGASFKINESHKLSNYILKNESNKTNIINDKNDTQKKIKVTENDDNEKWSLDTSTEAINERKQQLHIDSKENSNKELVSNVYPIENFVKYINTNPNEDNFVKTLTKLKLDLLWSENNLIKYMFMGLFFNSTFKHDFYKKIAYLSHFVHTSKEMMLILMCVEKFIEEHNECIQEIVHVLNGLYESGIVDENIILMWYDDKSKVVSEDESQKIRDNAKSFIDWLKTAEIESDDDCEDY